MDRWQSGAPWTRVRRTDLGGPSAAPTGERRSIAWFAPHPARDHAPRAPVAVWDRGRRLHRSAQDNELRWFVVFPFEGRASAAVLWAHLTRAPSPTSSVQTTLPETVDPVLHRALAKEPAQRYPSSRALVQALRAALG